MHHVRQWIPQGDGGRVAAIAYCVCALYVQCAVSLLAWTLLPMAAGFRPVLIVSGSMAPALNAGDVVLMSDPPAVVGRGALVMFDDPAHPGRRLTHRVVSQAADGSLTTKGDANPFVDSTPVPRSSIQGLGRAVVPAVGAPVVWWRDGQWPMALGWLMASVLASAVLLSFGRVRSRFPGWSAGLDDPAPTPEPAPPQTAGRVPWWEPAPGSRRPAVPRWAVAAVAAVVVLGVAVPKVVLAQSAFADAAGNPDNDFVASTTFCTAPGAQTVTASADTKVDQNSPTTNYGTTADLAVNPRINRVARSLVSFALPVQPSGCTVTATLRLRVTAVVANRTLQAWLAGAAWAEGTATWNTQPATAGALPATAPTPAMPGWIEFNVTNLVTAQYAGVNNGFVIKDAAEGGGANLDQALSSRTGADPPQLVLNFGAAPARPAAPSTLDAQAVSAARVNLTWQDNATTETGFILERAVGGTGTWTQVATPSADTTMYEDTSLASLTTYDYRIRATNAQGNSGWSNTASATTPAAPPPPAAPSDLTVGATTVNSIGLSWTDNATDEDDFVIERSPSGGGAWTVAGTVGPDATSFEVSNLLANTGYDFRVKARNNGGSSVWSNTVTAATGDCATVPTQTLTATADAAVMQGYPTLAIGDLAPASLLTRSQNAANARALVQFSDFTVPAGCSVASATLRLSVTSHTSVRTIEVLRAGASWQESTVTWDTQPAAAGAAAAATTAVGWVPITVTDHVLAQLADTNHGFVIRDSAENAGSAIDINLTSKEGGTASQLLVTFGP